MVREVSFLDCKILAELMKQLGYPITHDNMLNRIQLYQQNQFHKAWVLESDDIVVGCIAVAITERFHRPGRTMRIVALVVDEQNRRRGIGRLLMEHAESFAKENGCDAIELTSGTHRSKTGTHNFYKSLGYKELNDIKKYIAKKLL